MYSKVSVIQLLAPAVTSVDVNSTGVDTRGFGSCLLIFHVGNSLDTLSGSVFLELEVEDSPDDSVWTDAADADLTQTVVGTNTGTIALINAPAEDTLDVIVGYIGEQRFVRGVFNVTGTHTNGIPVGLSAVLGHPERQPVNATDDV